MFTPRSRFRTPSSPQLLVLASALLGGCTMGAGTMDDGPDVHDASAVRDASEASVGDVTAPVDAGTAPDGDGVSDAGNVDDAPTSDDVTTSDDAGETTDAGGARDASVAHDGAVAHDAGGTSDAGSSGGVTLFGAAFNPTDDTNYNRLAGLFGGMQARRAYDGGNGVTSFLRTFQAQDIAHHAVSSYSFKYPPAEVIAGSHDAELHSFFQGIADGHPTYWTYWHEPDDELYVTHTFTPTQYRAAWAHIRQIADAVHATRPRLQIYATLIIMEYSMTAAIAPSRPLTGPNGMYPGDDVIDVFGVDAYNSSADHGGVVDVATQFAPVIDFAEAHHKPWAIGELGSCDVTGNPMGRATYLRSAMHYWNTRHNVPVFVAYFDLVLPSCDYRLDSDPAALSVWHEAVTMGIGAF